MYKFEPTFLRQVDFVKQYNENLAAVTTVFGDNVEVEEVMESIELKGDKRLIISQQKKITPVKDLEGETKLPDEFFVMDLVARLLGFSIDYTPIPNAIPPIFLEITKGLNYAVDSENKPVLFDIGLAKTNLLSDSARKGFIDSLIYNLEQGEQIFIKTGEGDSDVTLSEWYISGILGFILRSHFVDNKEINLGLVGDADTVKLETRDKLGTNDIVLRIQYEVKRMLLHSRGNIFNNLIDNVNNNLSTKAKKN